MGGTWDGTHCDTGQQQQQTGGEPQTQEECTQAGGTWDGTHCDTRQQQQQTGGEPQTQEECTQAGGTWDGSHCTIGRRRQLQMLDQCLAACVPGGQSQTCTTGANGQS